MTFFPHGFPYPEDDEGATSDFARLITRIGPPWLRRSWAQRILGGMATPIDRIADAMTAGVRARFPTATVADALGPLGRERRIRRGPTEPSSTYAPRLRLWLDAHRGRGGAYAMLAQLRAYWLGTIDGEHAILGHAGVLHTSIGDVVARTPLEWVADGTPLWPQIWVMLHHDADPRPVTTEDEASYRAIPSDWSAAHIWRTHIVLFWGLGRLWEYPDPVLTWATWDERDLDLAALTWDEWDDQQPITITTGA